MGLTPRSDAACQRVPGAVSTPSRGVDAVVEAAVTKTCSQSFRVSTMAPVVNRTTPQGLTTQPKVVRAAGALRVSGATAETLKGFHNGHGRAAAGHLRVCATLQG
jgi:hypothetical protein